MNGNNISIETQRLVIKVIQPADAGKMFEYRSDPRVSKFQNWKPVNYESIIKFINENLNVKINQADTWKQFGIYSKNDGGLIGDIGMHFLDPQNSVVEIGFTLSPENQGFGYGCEAVSAIIQYLFKKLEKHRIIASTDPRNDRSIALLKRVGMRKEAHFKKSFLTNGEWVDDIIFALLEEEYKK